MRSIDPFRLVPAVAVRSHRAEPDRAGSGSQQVSAEPTNGRLGVPGAGLQRFAHQRNLASASAICPLQSRESRNVGSAVLRYGSQYAGAIRTIVRQ